MIEETLWQPGMIVSQPGIYAGVPMPIYHGFRDSEGKLHQLCDDISLSSSPLRTLFHDSSAHCWDACIYNPDAKDKSDTEAMLLGRATHHLVLGEKFFNQTYAIRPATLLGEKWNGNRTTCKQWIAERELKGLHILTPDHAERILGMARSLSRDPFASSLLRGRIERTMVWRDKATGYWFKARPDNILNHVTDYVDLKCVASVDDNSIQKMLADYEYPMQAAMVCQGAKELYGLDRDPAFTFLFIESKRPHCIRPVTVPEPDIEDAHQQIKESALKFQRCWKTSEWPGPGGVKGNAEFVQIKPWDKTNIQARLAELKMERMT
jgi:hypothetical protein